MESLAPGALVAGRYRIEQKIGEGLNSVVYRAEHGLTGRALAIKVLPRRHQPDALVRFEREASAYARATHEAVIEIVDVGTLDSGEPYIAMEYVAGGTLAERLKKGPLSAGETIALGTRLCAALARVHALGMVHGDLKPSNIFLPSGEIQRAKLGDFGLIEHVEKSTGLTQAGTILGTPYYMSPEQAQGRSRSVQSDVWGLAVVLYESVYGRLPFGGDDAFSVILNIVQATPSIAPLPGGLERVLAVALAKERSERYASIADFAAALEQVRNGVAPAGPVVVAAPALSVEVASASEARPLAASKSSAATVVISLALLTAAGSGVVWVLVAGAGAGPILRIGVGVGAALLVGLASALVVGMILDRAETRRDRRDSRLNANARQVRQKADVNEVLSRSIAIAVDTLLRDFANEPAIDLRKASLALAISDFQQAKDKSDQRVALDRAILIADKLNEQFSERSRPWYVRHKEALTIGTAIASAAAALFSSIAAALK